MGPTLPHWGPREGRRIWLPPPPGSYWEPGEMGPPGAEPLGTGGGSRAWELWPGGNSSGPGLFPHSVVWGGWWAPEAGTEVEGSLVALSKLLGVERIPCRVAWRPSMLTKAWQGAEGSATLLLSVTS